CTPEVIDVNGQYISPGWIDLHVHVYTDMTELGIEPDKVGVSQGVTTIVDAGSAGVHTFERFYKNNIMCCKTEVLAFLNLSVHGLCSGLSELSNVEDYMSIEECKRLLNCYPSIVGIKTRMSGSVVKKTNVEALKHAKKIANETKLPIMVHIGNSPPKLEHIVTLLGKGDIITHAFHGKKGGILDLSGALLPYVQNAVDNGVYLDVGHGTSSFSFETMRNFKSKNTNHFSISTDIYKQNFSHPVGSLALTMTKIMALGYSLLDVICAVTSRATEILQRPEIGTWAIGSRADITVFTMQKREMPLFDSEGEQMLVDKIISPTMTIREGKVVEIIEEMIHIDSNRAMG
ncbi:MAG: amidohydrolase/deacetylase family metallohydrolase, partial [Bacilli bacterium]